MKNPTSALHRFKRRVAALARWLHIYLSMISFAVLLFFAVTGLTLNHAEWFSGTPRTTHVQGMIDARPIEPAMIVGHLRSTNGIKSALSDSRCGDGQCELSFKGPGYVADVLVERGSGKYTLTETRMGLVAVINDLHKGRDSGKAWSAIIDVSAILLTLVSATGLILIFYLHKHRRWGMIAIAIGALVCYAVYLAWVP